MKGLLWLSSFLNIAGGVLLITTFLSMPSRVPIVVLLIGCSLLVQGGFTVLLLGEQFDAWGDFSYGALFAGECLSFVVGAGGLAISVLHNVEAATGDIEMAPVLAGLLMAAQAAVGLIYVVAEGKLTPKLSVSSSTIL